MTRKRASEMKVFNYGHNHPYGRFTLIAFDNRLEREALIKALDSVEAINLAPHQYDLLCDLRAGLDAKTD